MSFIILDARKEIQKHIKENGRRYSAELTRKCTHLIAEITFSSSRLKSSDLLAYFPFDI